MVKRKLADAGKADHEEVSQIGLAAAKDLEVIVEELQLSYKDSLSSLARKALYLKFIKIKKLL